MKEEAQAISQKVLDMKGKEVSSVDLDPAVFDVKSSDGLVHTTVVWQRNKRRSGNHSALTKAEVSGGGKKPWRQKGTGRARAGSNTSPLWVGGGVTHGPKPRDYTTRVSKRSRRQALCEILSAKRRAGELVILDAISFKAGKTKEALEMFAKLGDARKRLVVLGKDSTLIERACRNIPGVSLLQVEGLNVYDVINCEQVICSKDVLPALEKQVSDKRATKA